jgi:uncharacterized damage-inducible protein DinB
MSQVAGQNTHRASPVAGAGVVLLRQCEQFIRHITGEAGEARYCAVSSVLPGGTIGKHLRHCLDHYRAALDGFERGAVIDYDHRERDVPMETMPAEALGAIQEIAARLSVLSGAALESPVRVRVMVSGEGEEVELSSTLGRELAFATHHAVHHQAMMGAIAAELGVRPAADFGKAPSTVNHERGSR